MNIYTFEQWEKDKVFNAEPGQEITQDIFEKMYNCMPPKALPQEKALQALREYHIPVHAGFLMGEPYSSDKSGLLFLAFGMNDYGKGKHYYYLGLSGPQKKIADGIYYYMDCMNAFVNNGLFPEKEFKNDAEAIRTAANYEATLYKYEYQDGHRIKTKVLYEPGFM